jgi:hypothetical protein
LELVIWKSKIIDKFSPSNTLLTTEMMMQYCTGSMVLMMEATSLVLLPAAATIE